MPNYLVEDIQTEEQVLTDLVQEPGYLWHGINIGNNDIVRCKRLSAKARK